MITIYEIQFGAQSIHTDHIMGVRDPQVLVKPLLGWKKRPIGPKS